jgi:hypothetical protein
MKREATLGFVLVGLASLAACAPEYVLGGSSDGGAYAVSGAGFSSASGASPVLEGGASYVAGSGGIAKAGSPGVDRGGAGGSMNVSAGGAPDGAGGAPGPLVCSTGIRGGGYVNPCLSVGEAGAGNEAGATGAGTPGECHAYDLIGAYWNHTSETASCIESVDDLSPTTGVGIERGLLADLNMWSTEQFVETEDGLKVGAVGWTVDRQPKLYVLDLTTGLTSSVSVPEDYLLAGVLASGQFVGAYWTGSVEQVDLIDPTTGVATRVGTLGDLQTWSDQFVLDRKANRVYALGTPAGTAPSKFYSLDLADGTVSSQTFAWDGFIGGVTPDGQVVGANFDLTNGWYVVTIDPITVAMTQKGALTNINGLAYLVYDSTQNIAYSVTEDSTSNGISYLVGLDLTTGVETMVQTGQSYSLAKQ